MICGWRLDHLSNHPARQDHILCNWYGTHNIRRMASRRRGRAQAPLLCRQTVSPRMSLEFIIFNAEFIILMQNSSLLMQHSSFLMQNSSSLMQHTVHVPGRAGRVPQVHRSDLLLGCWIDAILPPCLVRNIVSFLRVQIVRCVTVHN